MRGRAQCFVPVNVRVLAGRSLRALRQDAVAHARAAAARLGKVGGMGPPRHEAAEVFMQIRRG